MKILYGFIKKINSTKKRSELINILNEQIMEITNASACWCGLVNFATNQIDIKKQIISDNLKSNKQLAADFKKLKQTLLDFYNSFEIEDLNDFILFASKKNKIIKPLSYKSNIAGYIIIFGDSQNFNKKFINLVNVLIEYVNIKLEIISLYDERKKSVKERTEFLASVSHEFKTPLNSIIGFSGLLAEKFRGTESEKYLNNISQSSLYLMSLIQNVLDFSRSEYKPIELKKEKVRTKKVINDIIWSFNEMRKEKNIDINYTLSDVIINADLIRFKQLVYNLISNALKFSKENSSISILTYVSRKQEFIFEIKDTGDGISKRDLTKIFTFFTQVNRNQLKRQQGSGVGLALCRKILQAHGGEISVKSKLNHGSTFWFRIPVKNSNDDFSHQP